MADYSYEDLDPASYGEEMVATPKVALQEETIAAATAAAADEGLRLVAGLELVT